MYTRVSSRIKSLGGGGEGLGAPKQAAKCLTTPMSVDHTLYTHISDSTNVMMSLFYNIWGEAEHLARGGGEGSPLPLPR